MGESGGEGSRILEHRVSSAYSGCPLAHRDAHKCLEHELQRAFFRSGKEEVEARVMEDPKFVPAPRSRAFLPFEAVGEDGQLPVEIAIWCTVQV